jgi:PH and SEC7 domain-containing protein
MLSPNTELPSQYPSRSTNSAKALGNWERKSQYLLTEIVKYESYIDSLQGAMTLRLKKRGEKALERALLHGGAEDPYGTAKGKWRGRPEEAPIRESQESMRNGEVGQYSGHRRETAEMGGGNADL